MSSVRTPETSLCGDICDAKMTDFQVAGRDAVDHGRVLLRLWQNFAWSKTFARRPALNIADVLANDLIIGELKSWRIFPYFLQLLVVVSFLGLDDDVADTQLFDERHHLLLSPSSNGQHGNDGGNSKNHTEHGEQRAQLVAGEVLEAKGQIGPPLRQGS